MSEISQSTAVRVGNLMHVLAVVILLGTIVWGAGLYPGMPDEIPIHWNAAGEADDFRQKSIGWAFAPLAIALAMIIGLILLDRWMGRRQLAVPSERDAYSLTFGYVNLAMAFIFSWISLMGWFGRDLGPWLMIVSIMVVVPVLLIIGLYMNRITAERKALGDHDEPSYNPDNWIMGGFLYNNPDDPRTTVPKPPHTGIGWMLNLATPGGKLILGLTVLVVVATLVLAIVL